MYIPEWETLSATLARVLASGLDAERARQQICAAIADGSIEVRVTVDQTERDIPGKIRSGRGQVVPPTHILPDSLDWVRSKTGNSWNTGPNRLESYRILSWGWRPRSIALLELRTGSVIEIFDLSDGKNGNRLAVGTNAQDDPAASATPDALPPSIKPHRPGKRQTNGLDYSTDDAPLVDEMSKLMAAGKARSPEDAARQVVSRAKGGGQEDSEVKRLAKRYREKSAGSP